MLNQRQELTQHQERYCQNIFSGMSQRDAYKDAYHADYAIATIDSNASRLASSDKIVYRLQELNSLVVSTSIATVSKRKEILTKIAQDKHKTPITAQDKVRAISELNKMEGDYAPDKHGILGDIEITIVHRDKGG